MNCTELAHRLLSEMPQHRACIGLDGFIDRVVRVVDKRIDSENVTYIRSLSDYGRRLCAAAGLSLNIELVCQLRKLGGNGPIMANAFAALGNAVDCIGSFGLPEPAAEFEPLRRRASLHSIAAAACTDAYEFDDGKIIASSLQSLNALDWTQLTAHISPAEIIGLFAEADMIALNNWTMLPHMTEIWEKLLEQVFPFLPPRQRLVFIDLADPSKRTPADLRRALRVMGEFSRFGSVLLSCNKREALQIAAAAGMEPTDDMQSLCARLQEIPGIDTVVIHTLDGSTGCRRGTSCAAPGFYVAEPKISVGGGDHFNAGLAHGILGGLELSDAMYLAAAVSGYYVRYADSPTAAQLAEFLLS